MVQGRAPVSRWLMDAEDLLVEPIPLCPQFSSLGARKKILVLDETLSDDACCGCCNCDCCCVCHSSVSVILGGGRSLASLSSSIRFPF